ncbi:MAG: hypothetical protein AAFN27_05865 [Pseudomonadota bacterium]
MPFTPAFRDFDRKIDIVFGIHPDRLAFVFKHLEGGPALLRRKGIPLFIDAFEDPQVQKGPKEKLKRGKLGAQHRHDVLSAYPEASGCFELNINAFDRKKSKGSLLWAAKNGIHIHFVMSALASKKSQEMVVKKTSTFGGLLSKGDNPFGKLVPTHFNFKESEFTPEYVAKSRNVSGSELRWIYRMRDNDKVQKYVQFWRSDDGKAFKQCTPPWTWKDDGIDALWEEGYKPRHEGFYNSLLSEGAV